LEQKLHQPLKKLIKQGYNVIIRDTNNGKKTENSTELVTNIKYNGSNAVVFSGAFLLSPNKKTEIEKAETN
jgi:hypothetical protein